VDLLLNSVPVLSEDLGTNAFGNIAKRINLRHADSEEPASQEQVSAGEPRKTDQTVCTFESERSHAAAHSRQDDQRAIQDLLANQSPTHGGRGLASGSTGAVSAGRGGAPHAVELGSGVGTASTDWPLISKLELGPLATAVGCGRDHARLVLCEWGLGHLVDDVVLLVSELLTNALKASWALRTPTPIVLRLLANDHQLIIEAWDSWVEGFDLDRRDGDVEHGRGLSVVAALSRRWGVGRVSEHYKLVWCELVSEQP
jgi:anti-sigma regulatory factor (Ser/Thr protein kinase)